MTRGDLDRPVQNVDTRVMIWRTAMQIRHALGRLHRLLHDVETTVEVPPEVQEAIVVLARWSNRLRKQGRPPRPPRPHGNSGP